MDDSIVTCFDGVACRFDVSTMRSFSGLVGEFI